MKLDFEIAVVQQTRTSDRTFGRVPDPDRDRPPVTAGQPRPYLVPSWPKPLNMAKNQTSCALLVASGPLNSYIKFRPDWTKND